MTSLLCQTSISWPAASETLPNLALYPGKERQYNKNRNEGDWLDVTAVVECMSKEGMCHADCRIALIYYTFKPYLKCTVVFRMSVISFLSPKAVPSIHYLYIPSVLQRISGGNTYQPKAPHRLAPWALQCFYGSHKEDTQQKQTDKWDSLHMFGMWLRQHQMMEIDISSNFTQKAAERRPSFSHCFIFVNHASVNVLFILNFQSYLFVEQHQAGNVWRTSSLSIWSSSIYSTLEQKASTLGKKKNQSLVKTLCFLDSGNALNRSKLWTLRWQGVPG